MTVNGPQLAVWCELMQRGVTHHLRTKRRKRDEPKMETADGAWGAKCMGERVPFSNPMVLKHPPIGNQISR